RRDGIKTLVLSHVAGSSKWRFVCETTPEYPPVETRSSSASLIESVRMLSEFETEFLVDADRVGHAHTEGVGHTLRLASEAFHQAPLGREFLDFDIVTEAFLDPILDVLPGAEFVHETVFEGVGSQIHAGFGLADRLFVESTALGDPFDERL